MTFTDTRSRLATALSTVAGVSGYQYPPKTLKAGAAWPLLSTAERGPGTAFAGSWRVMVCLGGDERTATTKTDELLPLLTAALDPTAYVEQAIPVVIATNAGDMFALEITCRSE